MRNDFQKLNNLLKCMILIFVVVLLLYAFCIINQVEMIS